MTDDQRRSRGVLEGGTPGLATVHDLFSGRAAGSGSGARGKTTGREEAAPVVSLDGTRLNQHDLRDMIAQKEAEWRAAQAANDDQGSDGDRAADSDAGAAPRVSASTWPAEEPTSTEQSAFTGKSVSTGEPGSTEDSVPAGELTQPAWSSPEWGVQPPEGEPKRSGGRRSGGLGRRDRQSPRGRTPGEGVPGRSEGVGGSGLSEGPNLPWGPGATEEDPGGAAPRRGRNDARRGQGLSRKPREGSFARKGRGRTSANGENELEGDNGRPPRTPEELKEEAREILLKQLSAGPRTRSQLAKTLAEKDIPDEVAAAVLDRFEEVDLVDDAAFSKQYVENRHSGRGLARRALAYELRQKGVADETVREAVDAVSSDDELATARQLVRKKAASMTKDDPERRMRRLAGMLARKGYGSGVAYQAIREELADLDAEGLFGHPDFD